MTESMEAEYDWDSAIRPPVFFWVASLPKSTQLNFEDFASARDPMFLERLRTLSAKRKRMLDENSETHMEDALHYGEYVWVSKCTYWSTDWKFHSGVRGVGCSKGPLVVLS